MDKNITIELDLGQTVHDILVECNLIGKNMVDSANYELQADIKSPDDPETRSIICRAHTEAFGNVKLACRRYLTTGRTEDDNRLERLVSSTTTDTSGNVTSVTWEKCILYLRIPNFDTAVTDALKNHIHKYIVDYVMWRFLQNQHDEKCAEYKKLADEEDYDNIVHDLTCRDRFIHRTPQFFNSTPSGGGSSSGGGVSPHPNDGGLIGY